MIGGAHSTAGDFTTVLIALLNGGEGPNRKRILKKETADLLFLDQSTSLKISLDKPMLPNIPKVFTFGGMVFSTDLPTGRSAGSVWWAGAAGCFWYVTLPFPPPTLFFIFIFILFFWFFTLWNSRPSLFFHHPQYPFTFGGLVFRTDVHLVDVLVLYYFYCLLLNF
jgi:hypothetical protein